MVLGSGGLAFAGWQAGVLYGLASAGVDLSVADLIVGTSVGSVVGAALASESIALEGLYERQLAGTDGELPARLSPSGILAYVWAMLRSRTPEEYARRLGRLRPARVDTGERAAVIADRLLSPQWPVRPFKVAAVDAAIGELWAIDRDSGVPLVEAVDASCAIPGVWPQVTINGRRWIDGGVYSPTNAHLAAGYRRVVIIAPVSRGGGPLRSARAHADLLTRQGARVEVIDPDKATRAAVGGNPLDPARRASAARAGLAQARAHVERVAAVWL
ncbi:patatin-like phospholipase family protein [Nonomuraea helvata]